MGGAGTDLRRGGQVDGASGNYLVLNESTQSDDNFWTHSCGSEVMGVGVAMSVWYRRGPGPCAGTGEVQNVTVPYCPTCETEPNRTGVVYVD